MTTTHILPWRRTSMQNRYHLSLSGAAGDARAVSLADSHSGTFPYFFARVHTCSTQSAAQQIGVISHEGSDLDEEYD